MRYLSKPAILSAATLVAGLFALIWLSCNKDSSSKATVVIKCVTCVNGGDCVRDTCRCPAAYEGTSCQTQAYLKFTGYWYVTEDGSSSNPNTYQATLQNQTGSLTSLYLFGLQASSSSAYLTVQVVHDSIIIPQQTINSKTYVGVGVMRYYNQSTNSRIMAVRYKVTDNSSGIVDDFGYTSLADSPSVWHRN